MNDPILKAFFDSPEHKAAVAQARAERAARTKAEREAKAAKKEDGLARMAAPGLKEKKRAADRRRIRAKNLRLEKSRVEVVGREAALLAARWAFDRRCDGVVQSAKLHPDKFVPYTWANKKALWTERENWSRRFLTRICREVGSMLAAKDDEKQAPGTPSDIAYGRVARSDEFWVVVTGAVVECYRKTGVSPTLATLQRKLGFQL